MTFALIFVVMVTLEGNTRKMLVIYLLGSFIFRAIKPAVRDKLVDAAEEHKKKTAAAASTDEKEKSS